jgi:hypothetical protein
MDELAIVAQLRDDYPAGIDLTEPERRLAAEISAASAMIPVTSSHIERQSHRDHERPGRGRRRTPAARSGRRFGPKLVAVAAVAAAVAVATVIALQNGPAHPAAKAGGSSKKSPDAVGLQLADFASQAAASAPAWQPNEWVYSDVLRPEALPKPGATNPMIIWRQVDGRQFAYYLNGKLVISSESPLAQANPVFWKDVTTSDMYTYLLSLPTNPAALRAVIVHNLEAYQKQLAAIPNTPKKLVDALGTGNSAVFRVIAATLQYYVLPPKLLAAVYGVLAEDPVVHFDKSVTDNAGQTGVGFYTLNGTSRGEIMINPSTYAYMGSESVSSGVSYWTDLVRSGIVQQAGQTP